MNNSFVLKGNICQTITSKELDLHENAFAVCVDGVSKGVFDSAIAANLAKGFTLAESVQRSKAYISGALAAMLDLGKGSGPMNHAFDLRGEYAKEAD